MRAALTFGPGDIRVESMTDPVPDSGEVLVEVGGCGICGGDYSGHKPGAKQTDADAGSPRSRDMKWPAPWWHAGLGFKVCRSGAGWR